MGTRQLRMYGFHRIKGKCNVDKNSYFHELFLRGRPGLCHGITRLDKPMPLHKKDEPSLYLFRPMPCSHDNDNRTPRAGATPRCIRFSACSTTGNSSLPNIRSKNLISGVKNINASHEMQPMHPASVDAIKSSPQTNLYMQAQPKVDNEIVEKSVQTVY